ncbi:MAG: right-handed parallel beta-helix repeat-containing protein, partial [Hyphomicrobiales bacterium]|nr:right-handed parallel beta-helix repeat-containing protein [Hyphomicrobiales bacterium]
KDGPARQGRSHELRVYAGGFYFDDGDALEEVAGPRARIEWRIDDVFQGLPGSRLTLEGEVQYDEVREDQWEGGVRLRIPFGGGGKDARGTLLASLTPQERRMTESLVRDTDIVTAESEEENVFDTATNVLFNQAAVASTADGVANAVAIGPNTLIVVQGKGGQIDVSATEGQALQASQTLQGGGSTINVRGARSGTVAAFTAPGARPTLFSNDGNDNTGVVTVASNTHVVGLDIQGAGGVGVGIAGNHGIRGLDDLSNVVIERNAVSNTGDDSVEFDDNNGNVTLSGNTIANTRERGVFFGNNNNDVTLSDNTIANTGGEGVRFRNANSTVTVSGNTIANTGDEGVHFLSGNSTVTVSDNTIANTGGDGVGFRNANSTVTVSGNIITDTDAQGVDFENDNSTVTVSGNIITDTFGRGVDFVNNNSTVTVSDNTIANTGANGVRFSSNNSNVMVSGNTIANTGDEGVHFFDNNSTVTVSDNTIANARFDGVFIFTANSDVTVSDNTISNAGGDGMRFYTNNTNLTLSGNTFSGIGGDVFDFDLVGNTLLPGSTGNVVTDAPGDVICEGTGNFVGTLEVTDQNGVLRIFEAVDACT